MKMLLFNGIAEAEGKPEELAMYAVMIIEAMNSLQQQRNEKEAAKESELMAQLLNMNIAEIMREESESGGETEE